MRTNVLVLGKSGCGKSSLLNYLWGEAIAKAGTGRPVTQKEEGGAVGIYPYPPITRENLDVVIHDSWGMEADHANDWNKLLTNESDKREQSDQIDDWFHTILYCVSAKGARLEDFEVASVLRPLIAKGHRVAFVLTKCNLASREEVDGMRAVIDQEVPGHGGIVEVESIDQELRGGRRTKASGKDEAFELIVRNFTENLQNKVRAQLLRRARKECDEWKRKAIAHFEERAGVFTLYKTALDEVNASAQTRLETMVKGLDAWYADRNREAKLMLSRFEAGMLEMAPLRERPVDGARPLMRGDEFAWDDGDIATGIVMYMIPLVNLAYVFVGKEMHKDLLEKKLDGVIQALLDRLETWHGERAVRKVA